jgi:hypothetical protein
MASTHVRWGRASLEHVAAVSIAGPVAQMKAYGECDLGSARFDLEEFERICPAGMQDEVMTRTVRLIGERWPEVLERG